jgi:EAL domain-containing protein (putative c-di-GMP-specific phosphodiesterase class I)
MHEAKRSGKNTWVRFTDGMHEPAEHRIFIVSELQNAVGRGEMELHYQPIVNLGSDTITALEALIRWRHPARGLIAPLDFIPSAEETGVIIEIGQWVLRTACRQWHRWSDMGFDLGIGVNVSARELREPAYVDGVVAILEETGMRADRLVLELTESILVTDLVLVRGQLERLRTLGVRIALDDFGTGYSSLSYLQHLPIDILKIDKSFVTRVAHSERDAAMVRAIVQIAQPLEFNTGAEGVETPEQVDALRKLGCEWAQGYWFGRPMPVDETTAVLTRAVVQGGRADQTLPT